MNCTSNKPIANVISEITSALTQLKVRFERNLATFDCAKSGSGWSIEICRLEDLNEVLLVKFRKTAGDMQAYRDTCS